MESGDDYEVARSTSSRVIKPEGPGGACMQGQETYRVMIVEDDQKIARILAEELERYGMAVSLVEDFARVKEAFCTNQPDLVLLDINLPRYDGYYWCRQIRSLSKVPIIFISARDHDVDQVRALESGGDDYISKPFNLELAIAKINSWLRRTYGEYAVHKHDVMLYGSLSSAPRMWFFDRLWQNPVEYIW